jgi:hypothetical protein
MWYPFQLILTTNGKASTEEKAVVSAMKTVISPENAKTGEKTPIAKVEPEKPVILSPLESRRSLIFLRVLSMQALRM